MPVEVFDTKLREYTIALGLGQNSYSAEFRVVTRHPQGGGIMPLAGTFFASGVPGLAAYSVKLEQRIGGVWHPSNVFFNQVIPLPLIRVMSPPVSAFMCDALFFTGSVLNESVAIGLHVVRAAPHAERFRVFVSAGDGDFSLNVFIATRVKLEVLE